MVKHETSIEVADPLVRRSFLPVCSCGWRAEQASITERFALLVASQHQSDPEGG